MRDRHRRMTSRNPIWPRAYHEPRAAGAARSSIKVPPRVARATICGAQGHTFNTPARLPLSSAPKPQRSSSPSNYRGETMPQQHPKQAPSSPAHQTPDRHLQVHGVPFLQEAKSSRMRRWWTFFTSMMKALTRSCGRRAPTRVMRAGTGGDKGGEKVQVVQTIRRTCSAAQRTLEHLAR